MYESLTRLLKRPRAPRIGETGQPLYFMIDRQRQPDLLAWLYAVDEPFEPYQLLQLTEFSHLTEQGPLWFSAPAGSRLAQTAEQLCLNAHAGLALTADTADQALAHARWLLTVNDGSGGQSLATHYHPELWAALTSTATDTGNQHLFGPWQTVYSPAPRHIGQPSGGWLHWQAGRDESVLPLSDAMHYSLPDNTRDTYRTFRWLYWLDRHIKRFPGLEEQHLPGLIDNLELLTSHGIVEGRHLLDLAALLRQPALVNRPGIRPILDSGEPPHRKVSQLRGLPLSSDIS